MNMLIQHEQFISLYNSDKNIFNKLLDKNLSVNTFCNRIDKIALKYSEYGYVDEYKMKGDIFEIFAEAFFKIMGATPSIGVYNYTPIHSTDDYGVDATGLGYNGGNLTVQVKFRSDASLELTQEDLKQFAFQSIVNYNVNKDTKINMVLFTSAKGMHYKTENDVFVGRIRTIGIGDIQKQVNDNFPFWKSFADMLQNTVNTLYGTKISNKFTPIIFNI